MRIIYGYHKANREDDVVNIINYMAHGFLGFREHDFLGFLPITHENYQFFGANINGKSYTACHVFYSTLVYDDPKDIDGSKNPYILMFYGSDNSSYYTRFATKQEAIDFFNKIDSFDEKVYQNCYFYNS